jgi:hypothetical protein
MKAIGHVVTDHVVSHRLSRPLWRHGCNTCRAILGSRPIFVYALPYLALTVRSWCVARLHGKPATSSVFTGRSLRTALAIAVCPTRLAVPMSSDVFLAAATPSGEPASKSLKSLVPRLVYFGTRKVPNFRIRLGAKRNNSELLRAFATTLGADRRCFDVPKFMRRDTSHFPVQ